MAINLGSTSISNAYLGSTGVTAIYLGSTEVWTSVVPVIPIGADTFKIGGLGGTITQGQLALRLGGESLTYFVSQSGDIFVSSSTNYTINGGAFLTTASLTSFIDGGRCTSIGASAFSITGLVSASFPNVTSTGVQGFKGCNITYARFPKATTISANSFEGTPLTEVTEIMFPSASTIGTSAFQDCNLLVSASFPRVTTIGQAAFLQSSPGVTSLQYLNFPSASSIGTDAFFECEGLVSASFPAVTTVGDAAFASCISLNYVSLPSLSGNNAIGGTEATSTVFDYVALNGQIYVPSYYSQSNAGGVNGTLDYLSSSLNWTINWL